MKPLTLTATNEEMAAARAEVARETAADLHEAKVANRLLIRAVERIRTGLQARGLDLDASGAVVELPKEEA